MTGRIVAWTRADRAAVLGGGPAGLAAAILAARTLGQATLVTRPTSAEPPDTRTAALFPASVRLLERLGAWEGIAGEAAPLTGIRIVDATGHLLRAPETLFEARELGLTAFAHNVGTARITAALAAVAERTAGLAIEAAQATISVSGGRPTLSWPDGSLSADLLIGADGRASAARAAAGIATRSWSYPQTAIATTFTHSREHGGVSTEFHRPGGPMTTVPLPGRASSLVWVERPERAEALMALDDARFMVALEGELMGLLGAVRSLGARRAFPLAGLTAAHLAAQRTVLVGEAAHVLPPIGAQGLNLGFRDAAALADCLAPVGATGDAGQDAVLEAYERARRADVEARAIAVDLLNRSLLPGLLPFQLLRGAGLHLVNALPPLRRLLMRQGLEAPGGLPSLMREDSAGAA